MFMAILDALRARVQAGDSAALADYLQAFQPQLTAFIDRRLGELVRKREEAADIYQEMARAAWEHFPKTDLSDRDPFGWLCQIAEQRIIDAARKAHAGKRDAGREVGLQSSSGDSSHEWLSILAASITSPSHAATRAERFTALNQAIQALPQEVQDVVRWRYVDNLPTKEIAARTGKSDGAVRVLLTRTIQKLQELMTS
jgi:RNA polymerase sigma-70 factor, ECF subfamily